MSDSKRYADRQLYDGTRPPQIVSWKERIKNDSEHQKKSIDYYAGLNTMHILDYWGEKSEYTRMSENYEWFNGQIDLSNFVAQTNPLNTQNTKFQKFPAKPRAYNLLRTNLEQMLNEFRLQPFEAEVELKNSDVVNKRTIKLENNLKDILTDLFINTVKELGLETSLEQKQLPDNLETYKQNFIENYKDERIKVLQDAVDYLYSQNKLHDKWVKAFKHWLITGKTYTYKFVNREEIDYRPISPLQVFVDSTVEYAEDGEYAVYFEYMTPTKFVEKYYDELSEQDVIDLESGKGGFNSLNSPVAFENTINKLRYIENNWFNKLTRVEVIHVFYKGYKKIGKIQAENEYGIMETMIVSEEYKPQEGEDIKWEWVEAIYQGIRANGEIYIKLGEMQSVRGEINNLGGKKLPINGKIYSNTHSLPIAPMDLAKPYNILYIAIIYMMELNLAKNKGKVALIDKSAVPKDLSFDQFMYYGQALGYLFVDSKQTGNLHNNSSQHVVLDLSTLQHVGELIKVAEYVKGLCDAQLGFNDSRKGQVAASTETGASRLANKQSYLVTGEIFALFEEFIQKEIEGLLDLTKIAWRNGKKASFISSIGRDTVLEIDPLEYQYLEYGITVKNAAKTKDALDIMKNQLTNLAQNALSQSPTTMLEIARATSYIQLKTIFNKVESIMQSQADSANQMEEKKLQAMQMLEKIKHDFKIDEIAKEGENMINAIYAKVAAEGNVDADNNGKSDVLDVAKINLEQMKMEHQIKIDAMKAADEQTKNQIEIVKNATDAATKQYVADTNLKIAKVNK